MGFVGAGHAQETSSLKATHRGHGPLLPHDDPNMIGDELQHPALLIDIGNTRVKWGLGQSGLVLPGQPFATHTLNQTDPPADCWQDLPSPSHVIVANVAGADIAESLKRLTKRRWNVTPRLVCAEAEAFGVRNAYRYPEKLGVDRWVALIAARHAGLGPVCVADCGSAVTVDALDAEGIHLGGVIAPGLAMMRRSLVAGTNALQFAEGGFPDRFARETTAAIASGTCQAIAGLIERCFRQTASRLGTEPRLLLTGGDALAIDPWLELPVEIRPDLVLEGLLVIADS